jgi:hypothetical protein
MHVVAIWVNIAVARRRRALFRRNSRAGRVAMLVGLSTVAVNQLAMESRMYRGKRLARSKITASQCNHLAG